MARSDFPQRPPCSQYRTYAGFQMRVHGNARRVGARRRRDLPGIFRTGVMRSHQTGQGRDTGDRADGSRDTGPATLRTTGLKTVADALH